MSTDTYQRYRDPKTCFIPTCSKTDFKNPDVKFFTIRKELKEPWCQLVGRNCPKRNLFCCEDHLNCEDDLENYEIWVSGGAKPRLKINATLKNFSKQPLRKGMNLRNIVNVSHPSTCQISHNLQGPTVIMDSDNRKSARAELEYYRDFLQCFVPSCMKYRRDFPNTPYISIPKSLQAIWCQALDRNCPKRNLYVCGDHIDIKKDCYFKTGKLHLKPTANLLVTRTVDNDPDEPPPLTKYCYIPTCKNYTKRTVHKKLFQVPAGTEAEWCRAVGLDHLTNTTLYICEDHLNLEEDIYNYHYWKKKNVNPRLKSRLPAFLKKYVNLHAKPSSSKKSVRVKKKLQKSAPAHQSEESAQLNDSSTTTKASDPEIISDLEPVNQEQQNKNQDDLNIFKTCCFCNTVQKDCIEIIDSKPYVTSNNTKIILNDMNIEINFSKDTTPKTVCRNCDSKLVEMFEFVKLVSEAHNRLSHVTHAVDLKTGIDTQSEETISCNSDDDCDKDKYNKTNVENEGEESICVSTESVEQTVSAHKRMGDEEESLIMIKKCRNNDYDPLSFNNDEMFKCKEEIDDKEYVKEVIFADTVTEASKDLSEDDETAVKEEFTEITMDEGQTSEANVINALKNMGKDNLIIDMKEESIETMDDDAYEEIQQHEIGREIELSEFHQDETFN